MNNSILEDISKMLGIGHGDVFNTDILIHINAALATLSQVGACESGLMVTGASETWSDCFQDPAVAVKAKTYIYYKVRLGFDPPQNSYAVDSLKALAEEELWRINDEADRGKEHD